MRDGFQSISRMVRTARPSRAGGHPREQALPWGFIASGVLHATFAFVLVSLPAGPLGSPVPEEGIVVELVTARETDAAAVETEPEAERRAPLPSAAQEPEPLTMIRATRLLATTTLASHQNRLALKALRHLDPAERMEQLCDIEAMEQVHAWRDEFEPDRLVAYATARTRRSGNTLMAVGAAFRSKRHWYALRFKCELTPDHAAVASFESRVGQPVPENEWKKRNLPAIQ